MTVIHPFYDIPLVDFPEDVNVRMPDFLSEAYQTHGPIFRRRLFDQDYVYFVGPEANRFVLVDQRQKFSNYIGWKNIFGVVEIFGRGLLGMDGEEHRRNRKMMNPAFTVSYMNRYLPLMNRLMRKHTTQWAEQGTVDIFTGTRNLTFDVAAQALTGLQEGEEIDRFRNLFVGILLALSSVSSEEEYRQYITEFQTEITKLLVPKIEERRQKPSNDIFGMLVQARDEDGNYMSDEQLIAHINILLLAGHETSTSLSSWLLYLLTQHPDYYQRILKEQEEILGNKADPDLEDIKRMKVLENALSEAERLYPPVANGPRGLTEDLEFQGYHIPAGTFIFYSIAGSHYIPSIFKDPKTFDPDRFVPPREEHKKHPYSLVGFGGGPRICIGINFAQVEIKAMVSHILRNYNLDLVPGQEIVQIYDVTGSPLNGIWMNITPRT